MFKIQTKELVCLYREFKKSQNLECKNTLPCLAKGLYLFVFLGVGEDIISKLSNEFFLLTSEVLPISGVWQMLIATKKTSFSLGKERLPNINPLGFEILTGPKQNVLFLSPLYRFGLTCVR